MKKARRNLIIASIVLSLSLSGYSLHNKKNNEIVEDTTITIKEINENSIICKDSTLPLNQTYFTDLESIYQMNSYTEKDYSKRIYYNYLIDYTNLTDEEFDSLYSKIKTPLLNKAEFAHLIAETTLTDSENVFDGTKKIYQPITIPRSYDNLSDYINNPQDNIEYKDIHSSMNLKKFITMNGETLYYLEGKVTNKDNDLITSKCLYEYTEDNRLILLYRSQTGLNSNDINIAERNLNNESDVVYPINKTIFKDLHGSVNESYLREALDIYSENDLYYSYENKKKDFSMYKKLTK